jgi:hypothetical protein
VIAFAIAPAIGDINRLRSPTKPCGYSRLRQPQAIQRSPSGLLGGSRGVTHLDAAAHRQRAQPTRYKSLLLAHQALLFGPPQARLRSRGHRRCLLLTGADLGLPGLLHARPPTRSLVRRTRAGRNGLAPAAFRLPSLCRLELVRHDTKRRRSRHVPVLTQFGGRGHNRRWGIRPGQGRGKSRRSRACARSRR